MQDDLQNAYSAYQHALYPPKSQGIAHKAFVEGEISLLSNRKIRNYGIGLESSMIVTGPWTMQKRLSFQF
jgi:hypothetical protein